MLSGLFTQLKIREKIRLTSWLASGFALLLLASGVTYHQFKTLKQMTVDNTAVISQVLSNNVGDALYNLDSDTARLQLSAISASPHIFSACIYDENGRVFSFFLNRNRDTADKVATRREHLDLTAPDDSHESRQACPYRFPATGDTDTYGSTLVGDAGSDIGFAINPINFRGKSYGKLLIIFVTPSALDSMQDHITVLLLLFLLSMLVAMLLSDTLQRHVSHAIVNLANAMRRIAEEKNYGLRMQRTSRDEIGVMIDQFNLMLNEIENRDRELLSHRINLENVVLQRTRELERIRNEVQHSRDFLKRVIDNVPDPIFVKDHEFRYVMANSAFWKLLAGSEANIGKTDYDIFNRQQADLMRLHDVETLNSGAGLYEERLHLDGTTRTYVCNKVRTTALDGKSMLVTIMHEKKTG